MHSCSGLLGSAGSYERVIDRCVIGSRAYGLEDEASDTGKGEGDHITDECEKVGAIEQVIAELGDTSGILDGQWPVIHRFESPRPLQGLLEAGLSPEVTDKRGRSLLRQCIVHPDSIELLVKYGVNIDRRTGRDKATALMQAIGHGDEECVQQLLDLGADPTFDCGDAAFISNGAGTTNGPGTPSCFLLW